MILLTFFQEITSLLPLVIFALVSWYPQVFIQGLKNLNRAVNDDIVAVEMLPESEWSCPSSLVLAEDESVDEEDEANPGLNDIVGTFDQ